MYANAGTEAIAESFYRVMETQEMDGGQKFLYWDQKWTGFFLQYYNVNRRLTVLLTFGYEVEVDEEKQRTFKSPGTPCWNESKTFLPRL